MLLLFTYSPLPAQATGFGCAKALRLRTHPLSSATSRVWLVISPLTPAGPTVQSSYLPSMDALMLQGVSWAGGCLCGNLRVPERTDHAGSVGKQVMLFDDVCVWS